MKKTLKLWAILFTIPALLLNGCANTDREESTDKVTAQKTEPTETAEEEIPSDSIVFEGMDIEGTTVSSAIFSESRLTMVNVWATYCNPCLNEMPGLGELAEEYDAKDFQIIGIISDVQEGADSEMTNLAADLIAQTGADYTHLLLNESLYLSLLTDVTAVPTTFFIDANGVILDSVVGSMEKSAWEEKINALLEE